MAFQRAGRRLQASQLGEVSLQFSFPRDQCRHPDFAYPPPLPRSRLWHKAKIANPAGSIEKIYRGTVALSFQDSGANAPFPPSPIPPAETQGRQGSEGLSRRNGGTKRIHYGNGIPPPLGRPANGGHESTRIGKIGRGGSPSGPKFQARTRRFSPAQFLPQKPRGAERKISFRKNLIPP